MRVDDRSSASIHRSLSSLALTPHSPPIGTSEQLINLRPTSTDCRSVLASEEEARYGGDAMYSLSSHSRLHISARNRLVSLDEAIGWPAKVLWSLLKEKVERNVPIREADKAVVETSIQRVVNHSRLEMLLPSDKWKPRKGKEFMLAMTVLMGMELGGLRSGN